MLLWAYAMVVSGTGQQETSGGMGPNKFQNHVVELLGVQAEADAEKLARAVAGARASGKISLQNPVTMLGVEARLQGLDVMKGVERSEFSAALAAQARGGAEAQAAAQEWPHTAEAALEAERQVLSSAVLAQAEAGQMGSSTFEAAQIIPISEYLKEPLLTFRREVGQLGSSTCQGKTEAALRAVVQEAAVVPFMQWRPCWRPRARRLGGCLRRYGMAGGV